MTSSTKKTVVAGVTATEEVKEPEQVGPNDKIITKLYMSNTGDAIESILSELGGQLYSDNKYRLTLMIEEVAGES